MALYYQAVLRKKVEVNTKKGGSSDVNLHLILQFSIITIKMSQHIVWLIAYVCSEDSDEYTQMHFLLGYTPFGWI